MKVAYVFENLLLYKFLGHCIIGHQCSSTSHSYRCHVGIIDGGMAFDIRKKFNENPVIV
jgi:hypothetical protein